MAEWLYSGRDRSRRIADLERELEVLRATTSSHASRVEDLSTAVNAVGEQLSTFSETFHSVEERIKSELEEFAKMRSSILSIIAVEVEHARDTSASLDSLRRAVAKMENAAGSDAISALEKRADADRKDAVTMRTGLSRLESQLNVYVEEARKADAGLLELIKR
jgi:chromosome segregation ATPase